MSRQCGFRRIVGSLGIVVAIAGDRGALQSQVPDGWYVTTHYKMCVMFPWLAEGRVLLRDPETGRVVPVAGLPDDLISRPCEGDRQGANSILVRPEDGAILVGEATGMGNVLEIFLLELEGSTVDGATRYPVGVAGDGGAYIDQMQTLGDGKVLFSVAGLAPDLALGVLDPTAPAPDAVRLVRVGPDPAPGGFGSAPMTIDPERGVVYVSIGIGIEPAVSDVYDVPLEDVLEAAGADEPVELRRLTTLSMFCQTLSILPDGMLIANGLGLQSGLFSIDPRDGATARLCVNVPNVASDSGALWVDRRRGEVLAHFEGPVNNTTLEGKIVALGAPEGDWKAGCLIETRGSSWASSYGILTDLAVSWRHPRFPFLRGDCNGDGTAQGIPDAVFLLNHGFLGGAEPPCAAACDADGDGEFRGIVTDAVYLLSHFFLGGPEPAAPFPECGHGTEADTALGCEAAAAGCS